MLNEELRTESETNEIDAAQGVNAYFAHFGRALVEALTYASEHYGDAAVLTPYHEVEYAKPIIVSLGPNREARRWTPKELPAGAFFAKLCQHSEGTKDGPAFVLGDMVPGQRLKTAIKALYGVGLDIDTGTPSARVDAAIKKLGCMAVRYTTHSHGKSKTEFSKKKIIKFAGDREITDDLMREFCLTDQQWDRSIVDTVQYFGTDHTSTGIVCQITHAPMPKHRVVLLFAEPFVIENEAPTQDEAMKKWAKVPEALAALLGVPFDTSCTDPSRLFYFPRHAKGRPFEISLFGGPYFDWRTLELDNALERVVNDLGKGKSKSVSDEGRALGRWSLKRSHGFQIADVIEQFADDRIRHDTGHGLEIECPFDEDHSNAGDAEDRACLVVNAGEGQSEFFTVSCRHESCRNKTNLDMLGKMIKDGWFEKDVLEDEQFNAIIDEEDKPEAPRPASSETVASIKSAIAEIGERPDADAVETVLKRIEVEPDEATRDKLFVTAEAALVGANKKLIAPAKKRANSEWKAKAKAKPKVEKAHSQLPLPGWGHSYGKYNARAFVYGLTDAGEQGAPLHTPLHIASGVTYPDRLVQGRDVTRGIRVEFENEKGDVRSLTFTRSQALDAPKEGMIANLSDAGVAFTPLGIGAVQGGILSSGLPYGGGAIYDFPGWREDDAFLTPGGELISATSRNIGLADPIPGILSVGTLDAWRDAIAPAFGDEMLEKAPHVPAMILWAFVSPLIDLADEEMSLMLSASSRTTRLKTFSLRGMASVWGECDRPTTRGIFASFSATPNALERFAIQRSGCGLAIDESKLIPGDVLGSFVYRIVTGAERARLNEQVRQWAIAVAITSETPIAQAIAASGAEVSPGLMSRIIEIDSTGERVSDEPVESIRGAFSNYGHAGPEFVLAMLNDGWTRERIVADVRERVTVLNGGIGEREQERRASKAVAYIGLAGAIAKNAGLIPAGFDVDAFTAALWQKTKGASDTTKPVKGRVYAALAAGIRNGTVPIYSRYGAALTTNGDGAICLQHHGKLKEPVFALTSSTLAKIIGPGETVKDAAKILDDDGAIYRERSDRLYTRGERIGLGNVTCYLIYARTALGEGAEAMIEEHRAARAGGATEKKADLRLVKS